MQQRSRQGRRRGWQLVERSPSARLLDARRVGVGQNDNATWAVLAVPEDSEFCVLRALAPAETDTPVL